MSFLSRNKKTYLLDTNVLMNDPDAIFCFENADIYLSTVTIDELDSGKAKEGLPGINAARALRYIDEIRSNGGLITAKMRKGRVPKEKEADGGRLTLCRYKGAKAYSEADTKGFDQSKSDAKIILSAKDLPDSTVVVSCDAGMRLRAEEMRGFVTETYAEKKAGQNIDYTGTRVLKVSESELSEFEQDGKLILTDENLRPNEFLMLRAGKDRHALGRVKRAAGGSYATVVPLRYEHAFPMGVEPRNLAQVFAIEALMTPPDEIPLVILKGVAGTAKTFLAAACGLEQIRAKRYQGMLITRTNVKSDREQGHLSGNEVEKTLPLVRGLINNIEKLIGKSLMERYIDSQVIDVQSYGYLRGSTVDDRLLIVDEAQNTTRAQILEAITRAGDKTKVVLCGGFDQIDDQKLSSGEINGLAAAIEKMTGSQYTAVVSFESDDSTRSPLAREAASRLGSEESADNREEIAEKYRYFKEYELPKRPEAKPETAAAELKIRATETYTGPSYSGKSVKKLAREDSFAAAESFMDAERKAMNPPPAKRRIPKKHDTDTAVIEELDRIAQDNSLHPTITD